jgi:hypothetical protein
MSTPHLLFACPDFPLAPAIPQAAGGGPQSGKKTPSADQIGQKTEKRLTFQMLPVDAFKLP